MPLFSFKKKKEERTSYELDITDMKYVKMNRLINNNPEDISKTIEWQECFSKKDQKKIEKEAIKYLKRKLNGIEELLAREDYELRIIENEKGEVDTQRKKLTELKVKIQKIIKRLKRLRFKLRKKPDKKRKTEVHDSHANIGIDLAIIMLGNEIKNSEILDPNNIPKPEKIQLDKPYKPYKPQKDNVIVGEWIRKERPIMNAYLDNH